MAPRSQGSGSVGVGVIGARSMVARRAVLPALDASSRVHLVAAAALGGPVPEPWAAHAVTDYDAVIDHPGVEAVYIPLPNNMHSEWTLKAASAGKHVLCEKPLAHTSQDARAMVAGCDSAGVMLAEAWMTPFDPRWAQTDALAESGLIGTVKRIDASFTFTIGSAAADNYRWQPERGGGALLDVGIYCLGPAVQRWGAAPIAVHATMQRSPSGVDEDTTVELTWPGGEVATAHCSFVADEQQRLEFIGDKGRLLLETAAHTGGVNATRIRHLDDTGRDSGIEVAGGDPYLRMIDAFAEAVRGTSRWPRPVERAVEMLQLFDRISAAAA